MGKKVTRLYEQFQPEHYDLQLVPDRDAMVFSGTVTIKGKKVGRPSERITLHQKDLKITKATLVKHDKNGDKTLAIERINNQNSFDEVRLHAAEMVYPGNYTITLEFTGVITRPMNGIYPCYFKHDGKDKMLIATQFESHHAREAFPCIDEPEAKATFDLTLTTPAGEAVIANTPVKTQTAKGKQQVTTFETTPKMSTYLLAFVYGEMDYKEAKTKDGVLVRTYATPDNAQHTGFALDCAVKTLEFYNEYFAIPYPLPKCDFVALPDFASGAMENWGCITFREQALLVDPKNPSLHLKQW
ncbi:MAG TPA: M1 family metallopeptidase, partial [Candidatus Saccharimonadales bacterium]